MGLGVAIADVDLGPDSGLAAAQVADEAGFESIWVNETGTADALVTLGAWSSVVRRATVGTGVIPFAPRSSAHLRLAARQVASLYPDRFVLGVGVGQRAMAEKLHGRTWRSPLAWTEDELGPLRENGLRVVVGALGPRMLDLAARAADGVLLNWTTAAHAAVLRRQFAEAAADAGRDPSELLVAGYVRVAVGDGATEALAQQVGLYSSLPFYRDHWRAMGDPDDAEVALASPDGRDLRERLERWDALDMVVARIVPTPSHDVTATVRALA